MTTWIDVWRLTSALEAAIAAASERAKADAATIRALQALATAERNRADAFADQLHV